MPSYFLLLLLILHYFFFSFLFLHLLCNIAASLYTNREEAKTEIKNYPIFHIRLLRDKQASVLLRGSVAFGVMPQKQQIKRLSCSSSSFFLSLFWLPFFHVGEQWLKWLDWSSLMGSQMKPVRAWEINWFVLKAVTPVAPPAVRPLI